MAAARSPIEDDAHSGLECDAAHWEASTGLVSSQTRCLAIGALLGSMHDAGIKRPAEFGDIDAELIRTNLSDEQGAELGEAFGLED